MRLFPAVLISRSITRTASSILATTTALAVALCVTSASAQQLRFTTTAAGGIAATGNTLGLSKALNQNGPGVEDSIGTFISLDSSSVDDVPLNALNPWPTSTTWDWMNNGSDAVLALPIGAEVLHAELVWAGSYNYVENVAAFLEDPIIFGRGASTTSVAPDPATALTITETSYTGFAANYYLRSADVTTFVAQHGSGSYRVEGVPATQTTTINSLSAVGWSLVVAYRGEDQPIRNLSIFVGGSFVDEDSQQDYSVSGFCAPPFGVVEGSVVISALEGDADLVGDELLIGETTTAPFASLVGPNNPATNFFCSQINDASGMVDTSGSFGNVNHDAALGVHVAGGRQGWDLTTLALSSTMGHLVNDQTSAVVRTNTTGDSFVPTMVALALDVKSPDFVDGSSTTADKTIAAIGDSITVTSVLHNGGEALAANVMLTMDVDAGLDLVSYATDGQPGDIDGAAVIESDLATGVAAGQIDVNTSRAVVLVFDVVGPPDAGSHFLFPVNWGHSFQMCMGGELIDEQYGPPQATVAYDGGGGTGGQGQGGASSNGAGPGSGSGLPADGGDMHDSSGCGCGVVGRRVAPRLGAVLALALALSMRRRRYTRVGMGN